MMTPRLVVVPAAERVDRLLFNPGAEDRDHVIHVGVYRCPHCGALSEFNTGTLRAHERDRERTDPSTWAASCHAVRPVDDVWEWYFDFACIDCRAPVRVIYGNGGEFAMGCYMYRLLQIIEAESWSKDSEGPWLTERNHRF